MALWHYFIHLQIKWFNDVWWPGRHLHFLRTYIHMRRKNNSRSWQSDSVVVLSNYYLLFACFKPKHQSKAKSTCEIICKRWVTICCLVGDKRQSPSPSICTYKKQGLMICTLWICGSWDITHQSHNQRKKPEFLDCNYLVSTTYFPCLSLFLLDIK